MQWWWPVLVAALVIAAAVAALAASGGAPGGTVSASGWSSLGAQWAALRRAARGEGEARITYSFVEPGVDVETGGAPLLTVASPDADGTVSRAQWKSEVSAAFAQWSSAFAAAFPAGSPLTFVPLGGTGDEVADGAGHFLPLFHTEAESSAVGRVGEIRVAAAPLGAHESTLAYAYAPHYSGSGNHGYTSDMVFNSSRDWRPDDDVTDGGDGGYSVLYVAVHELGHALGFGHHESTASVMYPMAGRTHSMAGFASGSLAGSATDMRALREFYG